MEEAVRQEFNRVYDRIDEERENRHALEKSVLIMSQSVATLAKTVGTHIDEHKNESQQTVTVTREEKRDWRLLWFAIAGAAAGGTLATVIPHLIGVHP